MYTEDWKSRSTSFAEPFEVGTKKKLKALLTTHGVGQGLFYSGRIESLSSAERLDFVYDCGVSNDDPRTPFLKQRIDEYHADLPSTDSSLDALFISHLHEDHTSGLRQLLAGRGAHRIFLPYLTATDRATYAAMNPDAEEWYYEFLSDPVSYAFERLSVKKVVLISSGRQTREPSERGGRRRGEFLEGERRWEDGMEDALDTKRLLFDSGLEEKWAPLLGGPSLAIKTDTKTLDTPLWRFAFYAVRPDVSALNDFHREVGKELASQSLESLLMDRSKRRQLKDLYESLAIGSPGLHGDINNTSLVTFHGPHPGASGMRALRFRGTGACCFGPAPLAHSSVLGRFGSLLTGDVNLRLNDVSQEVYDQFAPFRDQVGLIFLPHHGSRLSWSDSLLRQYRGAPFAVVSAGVDSRHFHPSVVAIRDTVGDGRTLHWANQFSEVVDSMTLEG